MDARRVAARLRIAPVVEWVVAAAFLCATVAVASLVVRELRGPARITRGAPAARPLVASMPAVGAGARRVGSRPAVPRRQGDPHRRDGGGRGGQARPRRRERPSGSRSRHARRAADALLRVRRRRASSWCSSRSSGTANRASRRSTCPDESGARSDRQPASATLDLGERAVVAVGLDRRGPLPSAGSSARPPRSVTATTTSSLVPSAYVIVTVTGVGMTAPRCSNRTAPRSPLTVDVNASTGIAAP